MTRPEDSPGGLREVSEPADVDTLDFDKGGGLVAVVAQDEDDGTVLMVAFANREALEASLATGDMHFWSRSRTCLWRKGATSGNVLKVRSLLADCDGDAVLALVKPSGPACHLGERTCFGERPSPAKPGSELAKLAEVIGRRAREAPEGSYTARLLGDANLRLKKIGEESAELVAALATENRERARSEAADLIYHLLVALQASGLSLRDVERELAGRAGR